MIDKRQDDRLRVRFDVKLAAGVESREGTLLDVSRGWAKVLATGAGVQPGDEVRLSVVRRAGKPVDLTGHVVWSDAKQFALQFGGLSEAAQRWLSSLLEEETTAIR